jgi:Skp family chaperone for outer membrane proteins
VLLTMADTPAAQDQLSRLKDEYLQCKREDTSKYALIEVGRHTVCSQKHTLTSMFKKLFAELDGIRTELGRKEVELQKERDLETLYSQRAKESAAKLQDLENVIVCHSAILR